ncbi:Ig-like domain-containing protein [Ignavibacterium album]|uniref:Ig-like domain-containing protein n=1 Tax=Ignavibacterium album TaxID=591197 RepID=UPI0035B8A063
MRIQLKVIILISLCHLTLLFPQQLPEETSKVLVRFNEPMSRDGIFDTSNYKVIDESGKELKIFRIGVVEGDTAVVLFTESHSRGKVYKVIVSNLKDKAGNLISQDNNFASYQKAE